MLTFLLIAALADRRAALANNSRAGYYAADALKAISVSTAPAVGS